MMMMMTEMKIMQNPGCGEHDNADDGANDEGNEGEGGCREEDGDDEGTGGSGLVAL